MTFTTTTIAVLGAFALAGALAIKEDPDVGYFWHFTDTHIYPEYKQGSNPFAGFCRALTGKAGKYGNYRCDSPVLLLNTAVEAMIKRIGEPDFVLYGGDHICYVDTTQSKKMAVARLENITNYLRLFQRAHPKTRIFPVIGNHDSVPQFQFAEQGPFYVYSEVARLWSPFISADSLKTVNHSAYYTELIVPGLRLVALNSVIWYPKNNYVSPDVADPAGQFAWLRGVLEGARRSGERVIVTTHIPPGLGDSDHEKGYRDVFSEAYLRTLDGYNDIIVGSFYGHNHLESVRIIKDMDGKSAHVAFLTSSVTPATDVNPSVTMYKYKRTYPFTILDRVPIYVDIDATDKAKGELKWFETESEAQEYGIPDMSPESIEKLIANMEADDTLFQKFFDRIHMYQKGWKCDEKCKHDIMCIIKNPDYSKGKECIDQLL